MSLTIKVPPVGESITEVTLASWKKKDGDAVKMDEVIAELESDKATFELTAEKAGILKTVAKEGDTLAIGAVVASIEESGEVSVAVESSTATPSTATATPEPAPTTTTATSSLEVKVPPVGESITEVTLSRWIKKDGDAVAMDEAIAELESDKATFELTAEKAGMLKTIAKEGDTLPIGAIVCTIEGAGAVAAQSSSSSSAPAPATATTSPTTYASGTPSPAAAKILAEKGVDTKAVSGTGVGGRITKEDALMAEKIAENPQGAKIIPKQEVPAPKPAAAPAIASNAGARSDRREKMSSLRKTVAKRLVAVKNETAMLTTFNEVDMQPIMELRSKYKDKFKEKHGVGLALCRFLPKLFVKL